MLGLFHSSLEDKVLKAVKQSIPRKSARAAVTERTRLREELGLDSLGVVSLVFELEESLGVPVPKAEFDLTRMSTVADIVTLARKLVDPAYAPSVEVAPPLPSPAEQLSAAFVASQETFPGVIERVYRDGDRIAVRMARLGEESSLGLRMFSDQDLLVSHVFGYLRYEHGLEAQPSFSDPRALLFDVPASAEARDALAAAVRRVAEVIFKQNMFELTRFVVGAAPHRPDGVVADYRQPPRAPAPDVEVVGKVAFMAHFIDAKDLRAWDRSYEQFTDAELERFFDETWSFVAPFVQERYYVRSATGQTIEYQFIALYLDSRLIHRKMRERGRDEIIEKVEQAATLARRNGCTLVGFGGFSSIVVRNCTTVKTTGIALTTGNSLTVAMGLDGIRAAAAETGIDLADARLAVIGASGNICSTYSSLIAEEVKDITLVGRDVGDSRLLALVDEILADALVAIRAAGGREELTGVAAAVAGTQTVAAALAEPDTSEGATARLRVALQGEMGDRFPVRITSDLGALRDANVIVAASNSADPLIYPNMLGAGPIVICDIAVPMDTHDSVLRERPDVKVIQGGVVQLPHNPEFHVPGLPLESGSAFACMSETMVLGLEGVTEHFSYGRITKAQVKEAARIAAKHGFRLARLKVERSF